jgi:hypothetical protein
MKKCPRVRNQGGRPRHGKSPPVPTHAVEAQTLYPHAIFPKKTAQAIEKLEKLEKPLAPNP